MLAVVATAAVRRGARAAAAGAIGAPPPEPARILYRAKGVALLRAVVRLKLLQLAGGAGALTALSGVAQLDAALAAGTAGAAVGCSCALIWLQTRFVGELALAPCGRVRLSTLAASGARVDALLPPGALIPPLAGLPPEKAAAFVAGARVLAFDVEGGKRFLLAPRSAARLDARALAAVLAGEAVT
jgi:hypothetical protein